MLSFILIVAIVFIILFFNLTKFRKIRRTKRNGPDYSKHRPPDDGLRLQLKLSLKETESRLEAGMTEYFVKQLKARVLEKYPKMGEAEFAWKLLELKRYFMMTAILKYVPMYSESVDDIWHEMLTFKSEYQRFGETFIGSSIRHMPNNEPHMTPDPGERAWFDWVYSQLFAATPYTGAIWKSFFHNRLPSYRIDELRLLTEEDLITRLFNRRTIEIYPEIHAAVSFLIAETKEQIRGAKGKKYKGKRPGLGAAEFLPFMAGAMMFHSIQNDNAYDDHMKHYYLEEEKKKAAAGDSSNSGYSCGGWSENCSDNGSSCEGSHSGGGGDSGSSSSCSSSSCSSCGGGGD